MSDDEDEDEDEIPTFTKLNKEVDTCDCCGKSKLKRTVQIDFAGGTIHLGVTCCGKWFNLNMSGNPYMAVKKLGKMLRGMSGDEVESVIEEIQEANAEI